MLENTGARNKTIPWDVNEIYLDTYGFNSYPECHGIVLIGIGQVKNYEIFKTELYDSDPREEEYSSNKIRQELLEFLKENKLLKKDYDFSSNCIYDWEYEINIGL